MDFHFVPFEDSLREAWNSFVAGNPHAWPGQDAAIIDFERSRGHESFSFLVYDGIGRLVGVAPMFLLTERQARIVNFRLLSTGSSLRGGPLLRPEFSPKVRGQFMEAWVARLGEIAQHERIDIIRAGFPHVIGDRLSRDFYEYFPLRDFGFTEQAGLTLLMDLAAPGELIARYSPKCRNKVRRAEAEGCTFEPVTDRQTWLGFHELNLETFRDEGSSPYTPETLAILWDGFIARGLAHAFCVRQGGRQDGRALCATIVVGTRHSCYYWMAFNRHPQPVPGANNLLVHRVMEWLRPRGVRYFEIGSMEFDDPRMCQIASFKQSFGGRPHYGLEGVLVRSELKQATVNWIGALAKKIKGKYSGRTTQPAAQPGADENGAKNPPPEVPSGSIPIPADE